MPRAIFSFALLLAVLAVGSVFAQESSSFKLNEHVFNAGGHPLDQTILTSTTFRLTLDALGEVIAGTTVSSASFRMDSGLVPAYPPPGEVQGLRFTTNERLEWQPEGSRGVYNLYRDDVCLQPDIPGESTTDSVIPMGGEVFRYLVTVDNRLGEEGTIGFDDGGDERPNTGPCP